MVRNAKRILEQISTRRLIGFAVLLGYCALHFPFPISQQLPGSKDLSQPFPCQNHGCGCSSAASCWKNCCCYSDQQKIAWSKKHQVDPPEFVVRQAKLESRLHDLVKRDDGSFCDDGFSISSLADPSNESDLQPSHSTSVVLYAQAMKCHGQAYAWNSIPWGLPDLKPVENRSQRCLWRVPLSIDFLSIASVPPEPPPRLS